MAMMIMDPGIQRRLHEQRVLTGADRFDEVWEGTYMMAPMPNDEHQRLVSRLVYILEETIGVPGHGQVRAGVNVSDRSGTDDWRENYRVPDVAVFLATGRARNQGAYWLGGPDFVIEIVSPEDRTYDKLPFYAKVGVRELLIVNPGSKMLELYSLQGDALQRSGASTSGAAGVLASQALPFQFEISPARFFQVQVRRTTDGQVWLL